MTSRNPLALLSVFGIATLVRLPHYDVAWFGLDQIYFMAEARRVLAGHFDAVGPLASGLNIIGPLYSYLLAGLLWLRDDPAFLVLFNIACEVVAAVVIYDIGRRLCGPMAGIVAAVGYMTAPVLVISTRLIWNPSLLPALVVLGWWLVVRFAERRSTGRLAAVALVAGLTLTLHATGVFHIIGFVVAVLLTGRPSLKQFLVATIAGALPLVPVLMRLGGGAGDVAALGARVAAPAAPFEVAKGIAQIVLALPRAFGQQWTIELSTAVLHLQAALATVGVLGGLFRGSPFRPIWIGMSASSAMNIASAFVYTGPISWHYFIALVPIACLGVANLVASSPRARVAVAAVATLAASTHLLFVDHFDRRAIETGLIEVDAGRVGIRVATGIGYAPTLRELRRVGEALQEIVPDGSTAMSMVHGARGELWRETGAEFMPRAEGPRQDWPTEFLLVGPSAAPLVPGARVLDERVCAFDRPDSSWKAAHATQMPGWESPEFDDTRWVSLTLPRRLPRASLAGPFPPLSAWRAPALLLRGHLTADGVDRRRSLAIVVHGLGNSAHWLAGAFVNGEPVGIDKSRLMYSSMSRNEEWLIELSGRLHAGTNVLAIALDGQQPLFDLDVFEVPCVDDEWYR